MNDLITINGVLIEINMISSILIVVKMTNLVKNSCTEKSQINMIDLIVISDVLIENPVIAAVRNDEELERAAKSPVKIVFVVYGSILTLRDICDRLHRADKLVFVHVDMIDGLRGDTAGLEYIRRTAAPAGVVTTRASTVRSAKQLRFQTILRVFLLDSLSLETGVKNVLETKPDAV